MNDAGEVLGGLSAAAGLPAPRSGPGIGIAYPLAILRQRAGRPGLSPTDVVKRGRSTNFDIQNAIKDLGWEPRVSMKDGLEALSKWIEDEGGAAKVAARRRPPAGAESVDEQVREAGGD